MKSVHNFLFLRVLLGVLLLGSFAFGACTLTLNPTSTDIREGNTARISYSATCTNNRYHLIVYRTVPISATAGDDYTSHRSNQLEQYNIYGGWVLAQPGSFSRSASGGFNVNAKTDNITEGNERYKVEFQMYEYHSGSWNLIANSQKETTVTINDAQPLSIHVDSTTVYEGETARIRIYITGDIPQGYVVNVHYNTSDYTAHDGTNYTGVSGDITFTPTYKEEYINVKTINDGVNTGLLRYRLNFRAGNSTTRTAYQGIRNTAGVSIGFSRDTYTGNEGSNLVFNVESSGVSSEPINVNYRISNITATAGSDYTAPNNSMTGTLTFPANVTTNTQTIQIPLLADTLTDDNEEFQIRLSLASTPEIQTNITRSTATGIIKDVNPNHYQVGFTQMEYSGNEGDNLAFTVQIDRRPTSDVTIYYSTSSSTAIADSDYTQTQGFITFTPSGSLRQNIRVKLLNDTEADEPNEKFFMTLTTSNPSVDIYNPDATGIIRGQDWDEGSALDESVTCAGSTYCRSENLKPNFTLRFGGPGYAVYGDMTATGESVMCPVMYNGGACDWGSTTTAENQPTKKLNEAGFTLNSSYAPLILPDSVNKGEYIAFARLYWQGFVSEHDLSGGNIDSTKTNLKNRIRGWNSITFQTPNGTHALNAKKADTNWMGLWSKSNGARFLYQASVDVTDIIKNYIDSNTFQSTHNKRFAAGNIVTTSEGVDSGIVFYTKRNFDIATWGHWGGWSLIVSYDMSEASSIPSDIKYKNVAIYDGFNYLAPWRDAHTDSVRVEVTGFMTPAKGDIDASMTLFTGSGSGPLHNSYGYFQIHNPNTGYDYRLSNALNPETQPANGSYTFKGTALNTGRMNHAGTDLDTFDVSRYMSNKQSSATLELEAHYNTSNRYAYQASPSMLAFTTELYSPKVCYEEHIYYNDKEVPNEIIPIRGSTLLTRLEIRNEGQEAAEKIKLYMPFDQNYTYVDDSLMVGNTNSNSIPGGDPDNITTPAPAGPLVENYPYSSNTLNSLGEGNISVNIGRQANASDGGTFMVPISITPYSGDSARVDYNMTFNVLDFEQRRYDVYYENSKLGIKYEGRIFECVESDKSFRAGVLGDFNAISRRIPSGTMLDSDPDTAKGQSVNSLYTRVAGVPYRVYIASLKDTSDGNHKELNRYTGKVKVDLVRAMSYQSCDSKPTQEEKNECIKYQCNHVQNASLIPTTITNNGVVNFNNDEQRELTFTTNSASSPAMVRIRYDDELDARTFEQELSANESKCVTSLDGFVVRPAKYDMDLNETEPYYPDRRYQLEANATIYHSHTVALRYALGAIADTNVTVQRNQEAGCPIVDKNETTMGFTNGVLGFNTIKTANVGDYNITIFDGEWTEIDQTEKVDEHGHNDGADCILDSSQQTENAEGKVGCDINSTETFTFSPKAFRIVNTRLNNAHTAIPAVATDANFTYVSPPNPITGRTYPDMRATFTFDIEAVMDYNASTSIYAAPIATAYDGTCSAYNTDIDVSLIKASADWSDDDRNITEYMIYDDDGVSTFFLDATDGNATLRTNNTNFTAGIANIVVPFNFDRNVSKPLEPFDVNKTDFNITVTDVNGVTGSDFNRSDLTNPTATFYFGRLWSPDRIGPLPSLTTIFRYEVYCNTLDLVKPCDNARWRLGNLNLVDSKWRLNTNHRIPAPGAIGDGNIPNVAASFTFNDPAGIGPTQITRPNANILTSGVESGVVITANPRSPYATQLVSNPSRWLPANNPTGSFSREEFLNRGNWSGEGNLGQVVTENNVSTRRNNRMEW